MAMASSGEAARPSVIDAHLHVWPSPSAYTYAEGKAPPDSLAEVSSAESLLEQFAKAGVDGALVVQPINLKFDHSYVPRSSKSTPANSSGAASRIRPNTAAAWTS